MAEAGTGGSHLLNVSHEPGSHPRKQVIALVPVNAGPESQHTKDWVILQQLMSDTHNDFLPAIRGCVAHDPPRTILCFSSKKSAAGSHAVSQVVVGAGVSQIWNLVHSPV